jgi:hypothetical protein
MLAFMFARRLDGPWSVRWPEQMAGAALFLAAAFLAWRLGWVREAVRSGTGGLANLDISWEVLARAVLLALLPTILLILKRATRLQRADVASSLALLLFAAYVVDITSTRSSLPIPSLLALLAWRYTLRHSARVQRRLDGAAAFVRRTRRLLVVAVIDEIQVLDRKSELEKKAASGDLSPRAYIVGTQAIADELRELEHRTNLPIGLKVRDVVLAFGPSRRAWINGCWAAKRAWPVVVVASLPLVAWFLAQEVSIVPARLGVQAAQAAVWIVSFVATWILGAFVFGYLFDQLRGESGLAKGVRFSLTIVACLLPVWLASVTSTDLATLFLRASGTLLFYALLGLVAFDQRTARRAGRRLTWRELRNIARTGTPTP